MIKVDEYGNKITVNAIKIPPNATNGDVIKVLFPDTKIITQYDNPFGDRFILFTLNNEDQQVNLDWWNALYKEREDKRMSKGALNVDKAIWELYEKIPHLLCEQPYGKNGRYITYYAEERLYLVFDLWYHGFFLVEADSPKDAIGEVNCDRLKYVPKEKE